MADVSVKRSIRYPFVKLDNACAKDDSKLRHFTISQQTPYIKRTRKHCAVSFENIAYCIGFTSLLNTTMSRRTCGKCRFHGKIELKGTKESIHKVIIIVPVRPAHHMTRS